MIEVGAGRRLNLFCLGQGSPTVIFESGSGQAGWDWLLVHRQVAKQARACVYDRAGIGFSDPADRARTSANAVDDLRRLLSAAKVGPPYVLVGNSYGAMNVQLFAYRYPAEVSGLVIVDGQREDATARLDHITNGRISSMLALFEELGKKCLKAARAGIQPGSEAFAQCVGSPPPAFGRAVSAVYLAQALSPTYMEANLSELVNLTGASSEQLRAARKPFGDMPVVCLTRGVSPYLVPGKPQSAMNKATEDENKKMQDEICALSSRGHNRVVAGAGHAIQIDKPQAVVEAVFEVLSMATH